MAGSYDTVVYCSACDAELSRETTTLAPLGHTPLDAVTENSTESSCTVAGSYDTVVYCNVCDAELSRETTTLDKLPHSFDFITCTECGGKAECNEGVELKLNDDGLGYTVTSIHNCTDEVIYLTTKDGLPITTVGTLSNADATTVILGESVAQISSTAYFSNYELLLVPGNEHFKIMNGALYTADGQTLVRFLGTDGVDSFTIDDSITGIYENAFYKSDKIVTVRINSGITYVPDFKFCSALKAVYAKENLITSFGTPFYDCPSLEVISIPGSYVGIVEGAIQYCTSLKELVIPDTITYINGGAFWGSTRPKTIYYMGADFEAWKQVSGYMWMSDGAEIYYYTETRPLMPGDWWHFVDDVPTLWPELPEGEGTKGLEYQINDDLSSYTLVGYGTCTDANLVIPSTYNDLPVTAVDINLGGVSWIESITFPDSITKIGNYGFHDYTNLHSVTLSANLTTLPSEIFNGCSSLTTVDFGENSKIAEIRGFGGTALTEVEIPDSVVTIDAGAFTGCNALTNISFGENSGLETIGASAFYNCTALSELNLPSSLVSVGEGAFDRCDALITVSFGDNSRLEAIGDSAFYSLASLTTVDFGENSSLATIGGYAFSSCPKLKDLTLPEGLVSIGAQSFSYCASLEDINIPASVTSISGRAFYGCTTLKSVTFAEGSQLTTLSAIAFSDCTALESVDFGDNSQLTEIQGSAFSGCTALASVDFGANSKLATIDGGVFRNCTSLTVISIPKTVTLIYYFAFDGCTSIADVYFGGTESEWKTLTQGKNTGIPNITTIHYNSEI